MVNLTLFSGSKKYLYLFLGREREIFVEENSEGRRLTKERQTDRPGEKYLVVGLGLNLQKIALFDLIKICEGWEIIFSTSLFLPSPSPRHCDCITFQKQSL